MLNINVKQRQLVLAEAAKAGAQVVDDSETEPESELAAGDIVHQQNCPSER